MSQPVIQDLRSVVKPEKDIGDEGSRLSAGADAGANAGANAHAFALLYDRYVKVLYQYLLGKTGNVAEAEDLTSQTFLSVLENLPKYQEQGKFRAWLFCLARNKWVDFYRKRKRSFTTELFPEANPDCDFLQELIQGEKSQVLAGLVRKLGRSDVELLRLRLVAELEFHEIADVQDKSEAAVKKAYYRLIERMKKDMEQIYG